MTLATGRTTRVIGWYHSHPHITVLPSHVDVRTQAMYQLLDSGFIGLIFSCFNEDAYKAGRIQVIAFQSLDGKQSHTPTPVSVSPVHRSAAVNLESSLSSSEDASTRLRSGKAEILEEDTADSRTNGSKVGGRSSDLGGLFAHADANYQLGIERVRGNSYPDNPSETVLDVDPMDLSDSMQEAMHRSNLDMSGAEYVRKEIPLQISPTSTLLKLDSPPLASFIDLQHVLYQEEQAAYNQAISQNTRDGKLHPLTFIHHTSTYQASMCKLMEYCLSPTIDALQDRLRENEIRLAILSEEARTLEAEAYRGSESLTGSPHRADGLRASPSRGHSWSESTNSRSPAGPGSRSRKAV
ncbi:hypothetical protein Nepgr_005478 [Nepenthes gracilis]|uniref:MPN domain-containing protein n=1 Tax=Nepenthes gracilis TaxID=150966 RepID=A0AAD3S3Q4_NEPGR|nr:hypothetical protein Nepgr_005478 [Nepenthes gracilis]